MLTLHKVNSIKLSQTYIDKMIETYGRKNVMLAYDGDDTCYRPAEVTGGFGGEDWLKFKTLVHKGVKKLFKPEAHRVLQNVIPMQEVEPGITSDFIKKNSRKCASFILTARSNRYKGLNLATHTQVEAVGLILRSVGKIEKPPELMYGINPHNSCIIHANQSGKPDNPKDKAEILKDFIPRHEKAYYELWDTEINIKAVFMFEDQYKYSDQFKLEKNLMPGIEVIFVHLDCGQSLWFDYYKAYEYSKTLFKERVDHKELQDLVNDGVFEKTSVELKLESIVEKVCNDLLLPRKIINDLTDPTLENIRKEYSNEIIGKVKEELLSDATWTDSNHFGYSLRELEELANCSRCMFNHHFTKCYKAIEQELKDQKSLKTLTKYSIMPAPVSNNNLGINSSTSVIDPNEQENSPIGSLK